MKLHIFKSGKEPDVFGFTPDATGANLPAEFAPWMPSEHAQQLGPTTTMTGVGASGPVFAAIEQNGFYVARSETIEQMTGIPTIE